MLPLGVFEKITVEKPPVGTHRATVVRYATAADDYTLVARHFKADTTVIPATREPWILICETQKGKVLTRREVIVDRGQTVAVALDGCGKKPKDNPGEGGK